MRTILSILIVCMSFPCFGYTANQAAFEFMPNGRFRVYLSYTVPPLKEFREAYVEFTKRKEAETFYFNVIRGADFFLGNPKELKFINDPKQPQAW